MIADAIGSRLGEGCVGHLEHANAARGRLVDREGVPGQPPLPIGARDRIAGGLDLRQRGEQLGGDGCGGILAKERRILAPGFNRGFIERATHGSKHLGGLSHHMIDEVRRGKDGEDGRSNDDDPHRLRYRIELAPHPARAFAPATDPTQKSAPVPADRRPRRWDPDRARRGHWDARPPHILLAAAARMACHTRSGVAGISIWWTPSSARASTIALITAANAGVVPPSPPERTPSRFV